MHLLCLVTILHCLLQACLLSLVSCMSSENIRELLNIHNYYREKVASNQSQFTVANMNHLVWSEDLAAQAAQRITCLSWRQRRAQRLANYFDVVNVGRKRQTDGVLSQITTQWFNEREHFLVDEGECFPYNHCRNYRNMVNAKHVVMGCASLSSCGRRSNSVVLLCLYEGGDSAEFGFQYGQPCTGCTSPLSFCRSNLCVSCDRNTEQCDCRKTCIKEGVGQGQLNSTSCTCQCSYGNGPNCDQPCVNPEQYVGFDICSRVSRSDCNDPDMGPSYREFCPEVCTCRPMPQNIQNITAQTLNL